MQVSNNGNKQSIIKEKDRNRTESPGLCARWRIRNGGMMAEAIANAVVDEINQNALVTVDKGSSLGSYKVN